MKRHQGYGYGDHWNSSDRISESGFVSMIDGILPDSVEDLSPPHLDLDLDLGLSNGLRLTSTIVYPLILILM